MDQTVLLVVGGALCLCVLAALALLAFFVLNNTKGGDAYKGLPSKIDTSGMSPQTRFVAEELAKSRSNCWHYNRYARVLVPDLLRAGDRLDQELVDLKKKSGGKLTSKQKNDFLARVRAYADQIFEVQRKELARCPADAWAETVKLDGTTERLVLKDALDKFQSQLKDYKDMFVKNVESNL